MIRNQQQLKAAYEAIHRFESFERSMAAANDPRQATSLSAIRGEIAALKDAINEYSQLGKGITDSIKIESIYDIPDALIKARIAKGWPQSELATRLGVKTQQVQRWEADDYESISACRLFEISDVLGLSERIRIQPEIPARTASVSKKLSVGIIQDDFDFSGPHAIYGNLQITSSLRGEYLTTTTSETSATIYQTKTGSYMIVKSDDNSQEGLYRRISSLTSSAANINFDEMHIGSSLRAGGLNARS